MQVVPEALAGSIVRLEPYSTGDFDEVCEAALGAREIFRFIPVRLETRADWKQRLTTAERLMSLGSAVCYLTRLTETGKLVGSTSLYVTDVAHRRVEIGSTWILPEAQGTPVNTAAKLLLIAHAFEKVGAVRVEFKTDARNAKSRKALLRLGATEEGTLRSHMLCWDGHRRDSVYFSIVDTEWPGVKARLERKLGAKSAV